jgi:hypothetical protein
MLVARTLVAHRSMIQAGAVVAMALLTGCGGSKAPDRTVTTARSAPDVNRVLLSPRQIGPGYRLQERPDGHGTTGYVTLDLCGFNFASEQLRTERVQVNYLHSPPATELSNEVVSYQPNGAEQALREVANAAGHCPRTPVRSTIQGTGPLTYRLHRLAEPGLLPGYQALAISLTGRVDGAQRSQQTVAIYQIYGDVLSGVYTSGGNTAAQERVALHSAQESARNLSSSHSAH